MGVKVHGVNKLLEELERKFGNNKISNITDDALTKGALVFGMELRRQLATFKDKGYTLDELTISPPSANGTNTRAIRIFWRGPKSRYRIIHLNEWGTIRNPSPRGKGKIAKALKLSQKPYGKAVRDSLRRNL